ncbi:MAG: hypothetical protein RL038_1089 [Actinomycetota bacterium]|jgi:hypothetical protein
MGSEIVTTILVFQAVVYGLVYPRLVGIDVSKARIYDAVATGVLLVILWLQFGDLDARYRFIFFDTNWFVFGFLVYEILAFVAWSFYFNFKGKPELFKELYLMAPQNPKDSESN